MDDAVERTLARGSIADLQALLRARRLSVRELVARSIDRIALARGLDAVREVAPRALDDAAALDRRLERGEPLGPLGGVPVLLKDNMLTTDGLHASAGAAALAGFLPRHEAGVARRLRAAGAVIVGKTHMTELADYVSDVMPAAHSGVGGRVLNPRDGLPYGRGQGSSVGAAAAVAAGLVPLALGSETQNSIQAPACVSGVVGLKPSVGAVTRAGMVPLVPSQDSPGVLARHVGDAALALRCLAGPDCRDGATFELAGAVLQDAEAVPLSACTLGVPRLGFDAPRAFEAVLARLSAAGARLVDPCDIPSAPELMPLRSCVFRTEFKAALDVFLADHDAPCGIGSLDALIAWNAAHPQTLPYGQSLLLAAAASSGLDDPAYRRDRSRDIALSRTHGIDAALAAHAADVLMLPMSAAAKISGKAGAPVVALPAGRDAMGRPFGITLLAARGADAALLRVAAAVERALGHAFEPAAIHTPVSV